MQPDMSGGARRRPGERRLIRAELQLLLADLAEAESSSTVQHDDAPAGAISLTIARLARRALAADYLTEVELGRMVLDSATG